MRRRAMRGVAVAGSRRAGHPFGHARASPPSTQRPDHISHDVYNVRADVPIFASVADLPVETGRQLVGIASRGGDLPPTMRTKIVTASRALAGAAVERPGRDRETEPRSPAHDGQSGQVDG